MVLVVGIFQTAEGHSPEQHGSVKFWIAWVLPRFNINTHGGPLSNLMEAFLNTTSVSLFGIFDVTDNQPQRFFEHEMASGIQAEIADGHHNLNVL